MQFEGQTTVITGAASGIGAATAKLFAERGSRVLLVDQNGLGLDEVISDIRSKRGTAQRAVADV
ncbi:MAG: SDR family NAD(P)-dependent oxidoreductase, partial [Pseudomonadota bacterium]